MTARQTPLVHLLADSQGEQRGLLALQWVVNFIPIDLICYLTSTIFFHLAFYLLMGYSMLDSCDS